MCHLTELFLSSFEIPRIHLPFCLLPTCAENWVFEGNNQDYTSTFHLLIWSCCVSVMKDYTVATLIGLRSLFDLHQTDS